MMQNKVQVSGIQLGPFPGDQKRNWYKIERVLEEVVTRETPYLVAFSELMSAPYFATSRNDKYFEDYSETMEGETVSKCMNLAVTYNTHIIGTLFEREMNRGQSHYFNTAFVCSPTKGLIGKYRKVHLPKIESKSLSTDEKYYFEQYGDGGSEFPVFVLDNGLRVGILICFDRSFPEAWRCLSLQGVDLVVVPTATYGFRKDLYLQELRVRAMENNVYVLAVNKSGEESIEGEAEPRDHFGRSCIINPFGDVISHLEDSTWSYVTGGVQSELVDLARERINWLDERKTDVYKKYKI
ncbi:carbon-nitrogen hydrolase family protein [Virgibacillus sediminis]|uniref:Carbon-nitrogen hydrolase family protein n=1 Tax=Virgibacillus sediminis TaxID=202260 RepID=A0ABV7A7W8_9BACI